MGAENDRNSENNMLDALSCEKIARFLTPPKRGIVFFRTLAVKEELSQGDLAKAVGSTATALSNLLSRFDKFEYKLLEVQNVGKYRYYKLSKFGRAYLEVVGRPTGCEIECEWKDKESLLLQEAEGSIFDEKRAFVKKYAAENNYAKWKENLTHSIDLDNIIEKRLKLWESQKRNGTIASLIANNYQDYALEYQRQNRSGYTILSYYVETIIWSELAKQFRKNIEVLLK